MGVAAALAQQAPGCCALVPHAAVAAGGAAARRGGAPRRSGGLRGGASGAAGAARGGRRGPCAAEEPRRALAGAPALAAALLLAPRRGARGPAPSRPRVLLRCAGAGAEYSWEEHGARSEEVKVYVPIEAGVSTRDVDLELARERLRISVQGSVKIDVPLWRAVDVDESTWEIETHKSRRCVVAILSKSEAWEKWEHLTKRSGTADDNYSWVQCGRYNEEVRIYIPVDDEVKTDDVVFKLAEGELLVALRGQEPIIEGRLWGSVDMKEGADWWFDEHEGKRCILVSLEKVHVRECWDRLLVADRAREGAVAGSTGEPGHRKDMDMAVLGQLEHVEWLVQQRRVEDAQRIMDIMTADLESADPAPGGPGDSSPPSGGGDAAATARKEEA